MKPAHFIAALAIVATPALAQEHQRHIGAHEHGRGFLNIAIEGRRVTMELQAPGSDIARSEAKPNTPERKAATDAALETLKKPLEMFGLPAEAQCKVSSATSRMTIIGEGEGHKSHGSAEKKQGHGHKGGDDHRGHSDYHGAYQLECQNPAALKSVELPYFKVFPKAEKLTIQVIGAKGATKHEATAGRPVVDLSAAL